MPKPRYAYVLTHPKQLGWSKLYSNLEALAADKHNGLRITTRAIRLARGKVGGYPVVVKGFQIDKQLVTSMKAVIAAQ